MPGHRKLGSQSVPKSGSDKRKELTATPIDAPARSGPPLQRPPPLIQSPDDSSLPPFLSQHGSPHHAGKMAIPRLKRNCDGPSTTGPTNSSENKHRVSHACEPCRQRKTKCSGERPICKHCEDFAINCLYEDGKRDRTKKEYSTMASRVSEYESLLQDLSDRVDEADRAMIQRLLDRDNQDGCSERDDSSTPTSSRKKTTSTESRKRDAGTEFQASGRKGSIESVDCINEDLNRTAASRATGFMGKNSEVSWMEQLRRRTDTAEDYNEDGMDGSHMTFDFGLDGFHEDRVKGSEKPHCVSESTYHCDDIPIDLQKHVQAYHLPQRATADLLLSCYLESVHPSFPILGKTTFMKQYRAFYDNPQLQTRPIWLAILNLLFALAARYGRLIRAEWIPNADDEHTYFSRARLLALGTEVLWVHGELQTIQVTGLTSFYLMATNQINRAYAMSGIAVRQALQLGLNLRNQDGKLAQSSKEIRYRVWWALVITERTLGVLTGRPVAFANSDCSTPLPLPLEEESFMSTSEPIETPAVHMLRRLSTDESRLTDMSTPSSVSSSHKSPTDRSTCKSPSVPRETSCVAPNTGLFFLYVAKLSGLNDDILKQLYRPTIVNQSWAAIQRTISRYNERLERWRSALPAVFDFTKTQRDQEFFRSRMCLGFSYYSTVIIINRPCLCKIDRKIPNETERGKSIDRANGKSCVVAARSVIDLLPDQPNTVGMNQVTPWWSMVHHLMQAVTILMLELSLGSIHCTDIVPELLQASEKAVGWLQSMSADDEAAARAWRLSSELLRKVAPRVGAKINDRVLWPGLLDHDVMVGDFLPGASSHDAPASSGDYPMASQAVDHADYQPVTTWEPQMFTSYDNYLYGNGLSDGQPPSSPQHQSPPQQHPWSTLFDSRFRFNASSQPIIPPY